MQSCTPSCVPRDDCVLPRVPFKPRVDFAASSLNATKLTLHLSRVDALRDALRCPFPLLRGFSHDHCVARGGRALSYYIVRSHGNSRSSCNTHHIMSRYTPPLGYAVACRLCCHPLLLHRGDAADAALCARPHLPHGDVRVCSHLQGEARSQTRSRVCEGRGQVLGGGRFWVGADACRIAVALPQKRRGIPPPTNPSPRSGGFEVRFCRALA